jgi:hypothetical protein
MMLDTLLDAADHAGDFFTFRIERTGLPEEQGCPLFGQVSWPPARV